MLCIPCHPACQECCTMQGPAGIEHCQWTPDGSHVILVAAFRIRLAIWSLLERVSFRSTSNTIQAAARACSQGAKAVMHLRASIEWMDILKRRSICVLPYAELCTYKWAKILRARVGLQLRGGDHGIAGGAASPCHHVIVAFHADAYNSTMSLAALHCPSAVFIDMVALEHQHG